MNTSKHKVIICAAKWWAKFVDDDIKFMMHLQDAIFQYLEDKPWDEDNPQSGEALRVIYTEYSPGPVISEAIKKSGVKVRYDTFPDKMVMWISPESVKVRQYKGEIEVIYPLDSEN